ncbi:hypothetical protein [Geothrix sp. PMB-07]|uniref:hypothetical protein n=1 Tax=Geothrix sp. PMB-07 TaxID=3068640 RepID=UPI002742976F|nr:hypothetical protein [Geothrix sp. PMB-07]WLT30067.1 hypothetical protein Q9293_10095 [Geothrix sp. PMB-07]
MKVRSLALGAGLVGSLAAQGPDSGFGWVGLRGGSLALDPQDHTKAAGFLGGQAGMVFDQQRYGWSLEGLSSHSKSDLVPMLKTSHSELSATLLTGLAGDALGRFWPYFGVGLGSVTVAQTAASTQRLEVGKGTAFHASLGWLHRPGLHVIWGMEGRYLMAFTNKDRKDLQASLLVGVTWGGLSSASRREPTPPAPEVKLTPPPAPVVQPVAPPPVMVDAPVPVPLPVSASAAKPEIAATSVPIAPVREAETALPPPPPPLPGLTSVTAAPVSPVVEDRKGASSLHERLDALRKGDMGRALELGRQRMRAIPAGHWTLRLEIANLPGTLANAVRAFPGANPDLFIAPIQLKGGKTAYQLFLGDYATKGEAEKTAMAVPAFFLEGGQRPKPFLGAAIPAR